jgi:integrase
VGTVRFNEQRRAWTIDYIDATGRRIRQTIGPGEDGKRLARKVLAQREAEVRVGLHRLPASQTPRFEEFARDWLQRSLTRLRPKTAELYEDLLTYHLLPAFGGMRLGAITRRDVEVYLSSRLQARRRVKARDENGRLIRDEAKRPVWTEVPFAPKTINHTLMVLKAILRDAKTHRHLTENPAEGVKGLAASDNEELRILQPEEIGRLLEAAADPWRTLYAVAVHTGLRRGELLALRWGDLDFAQGTLHVRRSLNRLRDGDGYVVKETPLKTRYSRRTIDLSPVAIGELLQLPAGDDPDHDTVFRSRAGGFIDPDNVDRAFKRHLTLAGLPDLRFHDLRHTHASLLIAAGVHPKAIQARLGHASITTTLNTYGHLMPSAFEGVGARLDALLYGNIKATSPAGSENAGPADRRNPRPIWIPDGVTDGIRTRDLLGHSQALSPS